MKFNYFRILVTILASFAAFFAYVCRLNLSLSIEHMTVRHSKSAPIARGSSSSTSSLEPQGSQSSSTTQQPPEQHQRGGPFPVINEQSDQHLAYKLPPVYNEEHSFAWISKGRVIISNRQRPKAALLQKVDLEGRNKSILLRGIEINSNILNIEVDKPPRSSSIDLNSTFNETTAPTGAPEIEQYQEDESPERRRIDENLLDWNEEDKNNVLGAFFYGYVFLQIPSARAAELFGAKSLLLLCGIGTGLSSLVFPFAAKFSSSIWPAWLVRLIMGASQGALFPVCYVFLCEWLPKNERSSWLPFPSAFSRIGTIAMNLVLPVIIKNYDWETVFYVSGFVTLAWCAIFLVFGSNSPAQSYWISKEELNYIESNLDSCRQQQTSPKKPAISSSDISTSAFGINDPPGASAPAATTSLGKPSIDWRKVVTNRPILILSMVMFLSDWSNFILLIKLPGFLIPALEMDLVEVGFWSSVLVTIFFVMYPLAGFCASQVEQHFESLNSLQVRKIFEAVAHALQAAGCLLIAFSDNRSLVIVALCIIMVGRATVGGGQCLMPPELSKDYPGTVFAYCNTLANLSGIIGPGVVNWLVKDPCEHRCWFNLFALSAVMFAAGGLVFCLFGDNQQQDLFALESSSSLGDGKGKNKKQSFNLSQAQLTAEMEGQQQVVEMFKMDAFPRVASEPDKPREGRQI